TVIFLLILGVRAMAFPPICLRVTEEMGPAATGLSSTPPRVDPRVAVPEARTEIARADHRPIVRDLTALLARRANSTETTQFVREICETVDRHGGRDALRTSLDEHESISSRLRAERAALLEQIRAGSDVEVARRAVAGLDQLYRDNQAVIGRLRLALNYEA